jgi:curved DNA-binding protein CbpA
MQPRLRLQHFAHLHPIELLVTLRARTPDRRAARRVQQPELDANRVRDFAHNAAQRIDFPDQVPLRHPADGRVTAHLRDEVEIHRDQCRLQAHARRRHGSLAPCVSRAHYDHVVLLRKSHPILFYGLRRFLELLGGEEEKPPAPAFSYNDGITSVESGGNALAFAGICECGRPADSFGGLCDRCVALHALELHMNASAVEIENSYRTLVKVWHPDRFQSDQKLRLAAEEKLKEINAAHEFLLSQPAAQEPPPRSSSRPKPPEPLEDLSKVSFVDPDPVGQQTAGPEELDELRGILRRQRRGKMRLPRFLMRLGFAIGTVAAVALLRLLLDSILSANPRTAGAWDQYKAEISRDVHASGLRLWSNATDDLQSQKSENPVPAAPPPQPTPASPPASVASSAPQPAAGPPHIKISGSGKAATP